MTTTNAAFDALGPNRRVPVAVTEYNLASFQELDNAQLMTRAANALFMADMIGQMAANGVSIANQWNLANGRAGNGTDYGLIDAGTQRRSPQYFALKMWSGLRGTLIPATSTLDGAKVLSSYAVKGADGSVSVLLINKTAKPIATRVQLVGITGVMHTTADVLAGESLEATEMAYNGLTNPADDLSDVPPQKLGDATGFLDHTVPPFSVTLLRFTR
jgi:hypothetical protein